MAQTWKDSDISLDPIKNQTIAIIGYGIQGDAQANNLKDSGLKVIIGLKEGGSSWDKAKNDGHEVMSVADACKNADIIHILIPDMVQSKVYKDEIEPNLSEGNALAFSHAAAIYWGWIKAPDNVDIIMVAPKGPGSKVRETYLDNFGTPSIVAVEQDKTGTAWDRTLGIAKGIGSARAGLIKTTFKEEVETDWFGEQADLCGGSASMELKLIVDMIQKYGINGMWRRVSETARYGGLTRGPMVMNKQTKEEMKKVLNQIQDGTFNKEWLNEYEKSGKEAFDKYMKQLDSHQIEQVGKQMRKMMWPDSTE